MHQQQSNMTERSFSSLEEAFAALPQEEQDVAIRCSEYSRALFLQMCTSDIYPNDINVNAMMTPELSDLAAMAGKYITIGKALVPPFYHHMKPDFTPEEVAVYQKYVTDGAKMVSTLGRTSPDLKGINLPLLSEIIRTHRECWDGSGFPKGATADGCNIVSRTVAVAQRLNDLATKTRSERPIDHALKALQQEGGTKLDPAVVAVAVEARPRLKRVFQKYVGQSHVIPTTECMIRRRASRPFALWYRPIVGRQERTTVALEAQIMVRDQKRYLPYETAFDILKKENLLLDLAVYSVSELTDTVRRLDTCQIPASYVALTLPAAFLNRRGGDKTILQRFEMAGVDISRFCLVISKESWDTSTKTAKETGRKLVAAGAKLMLSGLMADDLTPQLVEESGATHLRLHGDMGKQLGHSDIISQVTTYANRGLVMLLDGLEKKTHLGYLKNCNIAATTGILSGEYQPEDDMIYRELDSEG